LTKLIADKTEMGCMIMELNPSNRELKIMGIGGFNDLATAAYKRSQFFAVSNNEQGPVALAVNKRRTITIPDTQWLSGVLHPSTLRTFELSDTRSCAVVPIFSKGHDHNVWGLLWIESKLPGFFMPQTEDGLALLGSSVQNYVSTLYLQAAASRVTRALQGFVPNKVLNKVISGEPARETDCGLLLMADLKESTRISRAVGSDKWQEFTKRISPEVELLAIKRGYVLQAVVWDAFYLTKTALSPPSSLEEEVDLALELNTLFWSRMQDFFPAGLLEESHERARFCVTFGDTTRDLRSALNDHWTIIGTAMASVSKLEQACKGKEGWLFASSSLFTRAEQWGWEETNTRVSGTDEIVFRYNERIVLLDSASINSSLEAAEAA
jgi:class 3 adenylate cyclase